MMKQTAPPQVAKRLEAENVKPEDLLLCTNTDIDRWGNYHEQWLAVTKDKVLVLTGDVPSELLESVSFSEATEFRCQGVVGSGLLQARVNDVYVDILRYSNRLSDRFQKIARKLDRFRQGEEIVITPEDEVDPRRCPKCHLMLEFVGDTCPRCVSKGVVLARIWKLMQPYRWAALVTMLLLCAGISLDLVSPQLTRYLVDKVLPGGKVTAQQLQQDKQLTKQHIKMLLQVVVVLALVQVARAGVNVLNGRFSSWIGTGITFDMRGKLVQHLQQLSVSYYDRQQVGALVARVGDTEAFHGFINQLTGGFLFQVLLVIGVGAMMFSINTRLALYTLIPTPLFTAGSIIFWRRIYPRYYRVWDASTKQWAMLNGMLSGIRVVKAFSQEDREMNRFSKVSSYLQTSRRAIDKGIVRFNPLMGLVFQLGGWIVWYVGGRDVLKGEMTLGELMAFFGYLWMFYGPLGTLSAFTNWLTSFVTQAYRIFEVLDTPVQIAEPEKPVHVLPMKGHIRFEDVTFGYSRHTPVLKDVDLEIQSGEMIGIVGRSGSGKTTIVNLICRFYDVDRGKVMIDGVDLRSIPKDELRSQVGVVLQEPFLFRGSVWENIAYGKPGATPEEILAASKAGNCHDFIMHSTHAYDNWVGERGAGLSGGERQRVSIARVLLTDPRILILDEATSSVDAESEAAIQSALAEVVKGRTTIAIAHRLSTLRNANRILVVDQGRITETGTHEELIAKGGLYATLIKLQGQTAPPSVHQLFADSAKQKEQEEIEKKAKEDAERAKEAGLPDPRSHVPRWLTPEIARIHSGAHGALHVTVMNERIYPGAFAIRCFPVQFPTKYISLRYLGTDKREIEIGLLRDLDEWPDISKMLITEALRERYFVHTIRTIQNIEVFGGYLHFEVDTDLGPMDFMMRWQSDRAQDYGASGKMLTDTDDDRYLIPDIEALTPGERRMFQRFIYW